MIEFQHNKPFALYRTQVITRYYLIKKIRTLILRFQALADVCKVSPALLSALCPMLSALNLLLFTAQA